GEMFEIGIAARRPRVFRVDVQGRVEAHGHALFRATPGSPEPRERSGGASGEHRRARHKGAIRPRAKSTPVDIRAPGDCTACLLSAAAQYSTMGAPADLRAVDGLALNELIELENLRSTGLGTRLENRRPRPCSLRSRSSSLMRIRSARRSWRTGCARAAACTWCAPARRRTCSLASTPSTPTSS